MLYSQKYCFYFCNSSTYRTKTIDQNGTRDKLKRNFIRSCLITYVDTLKIQKFLSMLTGVPKLQKIYFYLGWAFLSMWGLSEFKMIRTSEDIKG